MTHDWTDEKLARMGEMVAKGYSLEQVGAAVGLSRHGVAYQVAKLGLKSRFAVSHWTDEKIDELKKHFAEGLSAALIAQEMGLTRNAVIGKLSRLGLTSANGYPRHVNKTEVRKARKSGGATPKSEPKQISLPMLAVADVVPLHVGFDDLKYGQCRYPYGDGPFTFCGCESVEGGSYCLPHKMLTHTTARMTIEELTQHKRAFRARMIAEAA